MSVDLPRSPKVPLVAVHGLVEVPGVATTVAERQPVAVQDVLGEEARSHGPNAVWDT